ncbi:MAG: hypothetical protein QOI40_5575 [Alphaproteobacteria bacterium]|jgi:uncharacterized membrane protein|nr:hypothetical protein [Alphaproteobacteria bacterium]
MARVGMLVGPILGLGILGTGLACATPARADLQFCNKTSYVLDLALGLEEKEAAASRGWFRVDPGQCKTVLQGALTADKAYVHARALGAYGASPLPQAGHADFCITDGNFTIAAAKSCQSRAGQRLARFSQIKPSENEQGLTAYLGEEADYDPAQARLAGIQRLLVIAGYDANPIDGLEGKKTTAALDQFVKDRRLPADTANGAAFFQVLLDAVKEADGLGFSWCNETPYPVMAAIGVDEQGAVTTRGWYRVEPGKCVKPEVPAKPARLYSFAEAVDKDGQSLKRGDKLLVWGGPTQLCTRDVRFEIGEQKNCPAQGLTATGFAVIDMAGKQGATVRFRE